VTVRLTVGLWAAVESVSTYATSKSTSTSLAGNTYRVADLKHRGVKRLANLKLAEVRSLELLQVTESSAGS
jgi:hypothetical protein